MFRQTSEFDGTRQRGEVERTLLYCTFLVRNLPVCVCDVWVACNWFPEGVQTKVSRSQQFSKDQEFEAPHSDYTVMATTGPDSWAGVEAPHSLHYYTIMATTGLDSWAGVEAPHSLYHYTILWPWPLLGQTVGLELRLHIAYTTTPY